MCRPKGLLHPQYDPTIETEPNHMKDNHDQALRQHLIELLKGAHAHATFDQALKDLPPDLRGKKPNNFPHTAWMLLEHLRIAQWDILDFSRNPKYAALEWPALYWPKEEAPPDDDCSGIPVP